MGKDKAGRSEGGEEEEIDENTGEKEGSETTETVQELLEAVERVEGDPVTREDELREDVSAVSTAEGGGGEDDKVLLRLSANLWTDRILGLVESGDK